MDRAFQPPSPFLTLSAKNPIHSRVCLYIISSLRLSVCLCLYICVDSLLLSVLWIWKLLESNDIVMGVNNNGDMEAVNTKYYRKWIWEHVQRFIPSNYEKNMWTQKGTKIET